LLTALENANLRPPPRGAYISPAVPEAKILNSWKEISNYVGRGVRTVQRWEQMYGLPVHRAAGKDRSAVYALSDEIDTWLRAGKMHEHAHSTPLPDTAARYQELIGKGKALVSSLKNLREQSTLLREKIEQSRAWTHQYNHRKRKLDPASEDSRQIGSKKPA
jgi:hypothetical protein